MLSITQESFVKDCRLFHIIIYFLRFIAAHLFAVHLKIRTCIRFIALLLNLITIL